MSEKILTSGNEAIAQGALEAGCQLYAGYPITPQNELIAYMAKHMPLNKRVFIQSESELAAINMVFGAAVCGVRAMTSSSSPGISLMQEGISYLAGAELPAVIVNIMRAGPGLGNIWPAQSDYFQATKGGGHGDYHCIVLAPSCVQEAFDLTVLAFDLADKYRIPTLILGDGLLGQMMEPILVSAGGGSASGCNSSQLTVDRKVRIPLTIAEQQAGKPWALTGAKGRKPNVVQSLYLKFGDVEKLNLRLQEKYKIILREEQRAESFYLKDAKVTLVAYGTMYRIAKGAMIDLREEGLEIGLIRPISLWPFPNYVFNKAINKKKRTSFLVTEMSYGQMVEDVRLCIGKDARIKFLGHSGGGMPSQEEIKAAVRKMYGSKKNI